MQLKRIDLWPSQILQGVHGCYVVLRLVCARHLTWGCHFHRRKIDHFLLLHRKILLLDYIRSPNETLGSAMLTQTEGEVRPGCGCIDANEVETHFLDKSANNRLALSTDRALHCYMIL